MSRDAGIERRLATILAADVVGYSRLMEGDDEATVRALEACRKIIDRLIAAHRGRVFGSAGDSVVAEFQSPVEAIRSATEIQSELQARNAAQPEGRRMDFRIGVSLGDVIVEGDNLLGNGVNVAARLEALADPAGIWLSGPVFDQVRDRIDLTYEDLGPRTLKNIAEPVPVYRVLPRDAASRTTHRPRRTGRHDRRWVLAAIAAVLIIATGGAFWLRPWQTTVEPASVERMAFPLPDKPSIAVLPFDNLGGDGAQNHFANGLTENLITSLSQISSLFVIARNSSFSFKGKPVTVQQVAEELGVRYVLVGSVQTSGDQVRISAQLVDALSGSHLWAERFDRQLSDLFALLDEITTQIVLALQIELTGGEQVRVHSQHTRNLDAWNILGRGVEHFYRVNKADNAVARGLFQQAIAADSQYALAFALLAWTHWQDSFHGWSENPEASMGQAAVLAATARALDDTLPDVYALQAGVHLARGEYEAAEAAGRKAVALSPNHAINTALLAMILHNVGQPEEAIRLYKTAMRLSPYYPDWFLEDLGFTYVDAAQHREALLAFDTFIDREPAAGHVAHAHLGRALAFDALGRGGDARAAIERAIDADTAISVSAFRQLSLNQDRSELEVGLDRLKQLGLPE